MAVIGAGWAGLSAAVRLTQAGHRVTLFEAARQLGGRARRVEFTIDERTRLELDNGQHILLGAYRQTLDLMALCGAAAEAAFVRLPITLQGLDGFRLSAPALPAPLHLLAAILWARGLSRRARLEMLRLALRARLANWRVAEDCTVRDWLASQSQGAEITACIWDPLCVAALNTPSEIASAQVFLNVLRDSLGAARHNSDMLLPRQCLGAVLPDPAQAWLDAHGARILAGTRVTEVELSDASPKSVGLGYGNGTFAHFAGVVVAVPSHQVVPLFGGVAHPLLGDTLQRCEALRWQPITTVYSAYGGATRLAAPMLELVESPEDRLFGQWVFDRGQLGGPPGLLGTVISAQGPHQELNAQSVAAAVHAQLAKQLGLPAAPLAVRVVREKRATFACTPGLRRPTVATAHPRVVLAGDYTASDYPATLESAVTSGRLAAQTLAAALAAAPG